MKITVVSQDDSQLAAIAHLLRERNPDDAVDIIAGSLDRLAGLAQQGAPDVLILDQPSVVADDLGHLERLGRDHPRMASIVLARQHTPEFLMQAMRAGVREVIPAPADSETLFPAIVRVEAKIEHYMHANGKVLAFVSCKGGSGATFLATNLGYALATITNKRVALIDLNLRFGDASLFVSDQKPLATLSDVAAQMHRLDASLLAASMINVAPNFGVLAAPESPVQANDVRPEHIDALLRLARRHYDFVLLDIGRSLDPISVRALDQADRIFPVLQTTLPFIRDGKRLLSVFHSLGYRADKVSLVVNRHEKRGDITPSDLAKACGVPVFMAVPNHYLAVAASVNQGVPILRLAKKSPVSAALTGFANALAGAPREATTGWLARVLRGSAQPRVAQEY